MNWFNVWSVSRWEKRFGAVRHGRDELISNEGKARQENAADIAECWQEKSRV